MQLCFNIVFTGSVIALISVGFAVVYRAVSFFHFVHGIVFTLGAYFTLLFGRWLGLPLLGAAFLPVASCIIVGCSTELFLYRHLRRKASSPLIILLSSLGTHILPQNVISILFGSETAMIRATLVQEGFNICGVRIMPVQFVSICVSFVFIIALSVLFKRTKIGTALRAVANDPMLASSSGINSNAVILWAFAIGSALAGVAGILVALDLDMTPSMGMQALMVGIVAMIVGGIDSITGIVLGSMLLSASQHLGSYYIGSQWQDTIVFIVLVVFLLFRPQGFFGKEIKKSTI